MSMSVDSEYCGNCGQAFQDQKTIAGKNDIPSQSIAGSELTPLDRLDRWVNLKQKGLVTCVELV